MASSSSTPAYIMDPPPGQVRTLVDPPSSGAGVIPIGVATTVVAAVCVALRIFTRVHVVSGDPGSDDYLVIGALAFSVGFLFAGRQLFIVGGGLHLWDIPFAEYSPGFLQTGIAATLTYAISISFSKLSILAFYLRVSPSQHFRRTVQALIAVVCTYTLAYIVFIVFRCRPIAASWDLALARSGSQCLEDPIPMIILSAANIAIDVAVLLLPLPVVAPLQMPLRDKVNLTLLFATGGLVVAAAIKRTDILLPLLVSSDSTWVLSPEIIWTFVEINAGIVCASLAALKPLFVRYIPSLVISRLHFARKRTGWGNGESRSGSGASGSRAVDVRAYELPSRDNFPATQAGARARADDDNEPQLWCGRHFCLGKASSSLDNVRRQRNGGVDVDSLDWGLENLYPGARPPMSEISAGGHGIHAPEDTEGIKVTKETLVSCPTAVLNGNGV